MAQAASNTFAQQSDSYAQARPRYPKELFEWLLDQTPGRDAAWDCATGNGQAAVDLAPHFRRVEATDISAEQVGQGGLHPNVRYSAQPAERTSFPAASFDLVCVAQALHWFDFPVFWREVQRVSRPGALFCAWGYAWFDCDPEVETELVRPVRELIAPHWARNNQILWRGYRDDEIAFPFRRIAAPELAIEVRWSVAQLIEYMQTWSAYKRAREDEPVARALDERIAGAQGLLRNHGLLKIRMPLSIAAALVSEG